MISLPGRPTPFLLLSALLALTSAPRDAAGQLTSIFHDLRVVTRTDGEPGSESADLFELCIAPGHCWPLDEPHLVERRPWQVDEVDLEIGPRFRQKIKAWTLRPAPGSGADSWRPSCLSVLVDGELAYCNDTLSQSIGGNERDLPAWSDSQVERRSCGGCYPSVLSHGPMVGHTTPTSAKIWFRTASSRSVRVRYGRSADLTVGETSAPVETTLESDFTGIVQLEGLAPGSRYFYEVLVEDVVVSAPGLSFETAPAFGGVFEVVVGSCISHGWQQIFRSMLDQDPEIAIFIGDYHYADSGDPARLHFFYRRSRSRTVHAELLARTSTWAIWDDHDYTGNDTDAGAAGKEGSLAAFRRYWANGSYGTAGLDDGIWSSFVWGEVEFFLLDGRFHRDPDEREMLGRVQLEWLFEGLRSSTAKFKVLVSGSQWTPFGTPDSWAVFPEERERIFDFVMQQRISGVLLVSGDIHRAEVRRLRPGSETSYPLWELTSSPLASVSGPCRRDPFPPEVRVFCVGERNSFGLMRFDTLADPPAMTYETRDESGSLLHALTLTLDELSLPD